jgi:hypothetical protein
MKACAVTITLYSWWLPRRKAFDGEDNSRRIRTLRRVPHTPENAPNRKYKVLMSLWLVEKNHLEIKLEMDEVWGAAKVLETLGREARRAVAFEVLEVSIGGQRR